MAAAVWEFSNAELALAGHVRTAALEHRLYYERFWLQEGVTLAIVAAAIVLIALALLRSRVRRTGLVRAALWLYAAISLAGLVSFHEIDRLLASPIFSIPLAQVAKLWIAVAIPVCGQRPFPTRPSAAPGPEAARSAPVSPRAE